MPAVFVRGQLVVGYSPEAGSDKLILAALAAKPAAAATAPRRKARPPATRKKACRARPPGAAEGDAQQFAVTIFGRTISLDDVGLPLFTLIMGLLDGFNPCSMWVLILMISLLAPLNNRRGCWPSPARSS